MSLLDNGPDVVTVYPEVSTTDAYGNTVLVPAAEGIEVRGRFQPSSASTSPFSTGESPELGQVASGTYRFLSRSFPAGPYGRVAFDGKEWDVVGPPRVHRGSALTRHVTTWLRER